MVRSLKALTRLEWCFGASRERRVLNAIGSGTFPPVIHALTVGSLPSPSIPNHENKKEATLELRMTYEEIEGSGRSVQINASSLRRIRRSIGWTQTELAKRSGYSERLIRKAEHGGPLDLSTVRDIAQALSLSSTPVKIGDLVQDALAIAQLWVRALNEQGRKMVLTVRPFLAPDFVFHCPGDPKPAPFIGTWTGAEGFKAFLDSYFTVFRRIKNENVTFTTGTDLVSARWQEIGYVQDLLVGPVRINMHFHFKHGLITRIDDEYDITGAEKTKMEVESMLRSRVNSSSQ